MCSISRPCTMALVHSLVFFMNNGFAIMTIAGHNWILLIPKAIISLCSSTKQSSFTHYKNVLIPFQFFCSNNPQPCSNLFSVTIASAKLFTLAILSLSRALTCNLETLLTSKRFPFDLNQNLEFPQRSLAFHTMPSPWPLSPSIFAKGHSFSTWIRQMCNRCL